MLRVVSLMAEPTPAMAATSVYLHFDSIESLILAVAERLFGELVRQQDEAVAKIADPCQRVLAGALAYCEFGLASPGHYQLMFSSPSWPDRSPRKSRRRAMRDTATTVNGFDISSVDALDPELRRIVERRASLLGPAYKLFYRNPVRVVRAEGVHLFDPDGQAYLDAYNNVPSVGHCHPRVAVPIARQAATLNAHTRYASEQILDYAERLLGTYPAELGNVMFTCTGSEAVDPALRIARFRTGGEGTVITEALTAALRALDRGA